MGNLITRLRSGSERERALSSQTFAYSLQEWANQFSFGGSQYGPFLNQTMTSGTKEEWPPTFSAFIEMAYKRNGVIFACIQARMLLFSEARFQFRRIRNGRPGDLFGTNDLAILEQPWTNGTTGDLLKRAISDADLAGNFYAYRDGAQLRRLRPDWVHIILGSQVAPENPSYAWDADVLGYVYQPPGGDMKTFMPDQIVHWAPIPDPAARFRGMSWLEPVLRELMADNLMTTHQIKYFEQGATPNLVVTLNSEMRQEAFERWIAAFRNSNEGVANAYKTMYLAGGASATVVGSNLEDFKTVKGHGETRIAAAAGVPPIIVGLSEGLESSTYSNYEQAIRRFADGTMRPLWRDFCGALAPVVNIPGGAELWYDDRDIAFLAANQNDKAQILATNSATMHGLIAAGYNPDSVTAYMASDGDYSTLEHSGLFSVQLQPAGSVTEGKGALVSGVSVPNDSPSAAPAANGANSARHQAEVSELLRLVSQTS